MHLKYLLVVLLLSLLACTACCSTRSGAFIGYSEKRSSCQDDLGEDVCAAYKASMMCRTGKLVDLEHRLSKA
jgi:hypothetical protein